MPISGDQETRVRPASWQVSDFDAGIPIKKRRFFIRPPSPPTEDATSTPQENGSQCKQEGNPSQGSAISYAGNIETGASFSSGVKENTMPQEKGSSDNANPIALQRIVGHPEPEVRIKDSSPSVQTNSLANAEDKEKLVDAKSSNVLGSSTEPEMKIALAEGAAQKIVDHPKVEVEEPGLPVPSVSLADVEHKEKVVEAKSSNVLSSEKTGMKFPPTMAIANDMDKETAGKQKVEEECQAKLSSGFENTEFPLRGKEHLILPVVPGQSCGKTSQYQETVEPLSLNLSLSKGECSAHNTSDISMCSSTDVDVDVNRSNWDLNTTMDAWEDASDGSNANTRPRDVKLPRSLHGIVRASSVTEERGKEKVGFRYDITTTSTQSDHHYNRGCSLMLGLGSFYLVEKSSTSSARVDKGGAGYTGFSRPTTYPGNVKSVNLRSVKSEPLDETVRQENNAAKAIPLCRSDTRVKCELVERSSREAGFSSIDFSKRAGPTLVNPEPANRARYKAFNMKEGMSNQSDEQIVEYNDGWDLPTCSTSSQLDRREPHAKDSGILPTFSTEMAMNSSILNYSECSEHVNSTQSSNSARDKVCKARKQVGPETISTPVGDGDDNWSISRLSDASLTESKSIDYHEGCSLKGFCPGSCETKECSPRDQKISLPGDMLEKDFCGTDYESEGGHNQFKAKKKLDTGRNKYEDGKVRGSVALTTLVNSSTRKSEVEHANFDDSENKKTDITGLTGDDVSSLSYFEEVTETKDCCNEDLKECENVSRDEKIKSNVNEDACLIESVDMPTTEVEMQRPVKEIKRNPVDVSEEKDAQENQAKERSPYQDASRGIVGLSIGLGENVEKPAMVGNNSLNSSKADACTGGDAPPKDVNFGGSHSRIINLTQVSSKSSMKTLEASGCLLPLRTGRVRLPDLPLEADKFLPRGRDEEFINDSYKFSRQRHHDQLPRNSRSNLISDRRREFYGGGREFPVSRIKYDTDFMDADTEFENYRNNHEDGAFVRNFQGGRRLSNDDATLLSYSIPSRRSPGFRFMHRGPNLSPGRCSGEDGSAYHGHRNNKNFTRGLPRNNMDPCFRRPERSYENFDGRFVRGRKNFPSIQRRYFPRFRSRSPTRSMVRSPGSCSSFRSASPDGCSEHSYLPRRRSPPNYRMERTRSPDHSYFSRDMVIRRQGSPPYSSRPSNNAPRDLDSGGGGHYRRSGICFRNNTSGRGIFRHARKFDTFDPRERTYCDDFFEGPMHSGRFNEFGVDGNMERRRFGNRSDPIRSFEPLLSGDDCQPSNAEDGTDAIRFCQEDDTEIKEQGSLREFDRRSKDHSGDSSRRARNIEKEGSSSHAGEGCNDDGFDDISRGKRKQF